MLPKKIIFEISSSWARENDPLYNQFRIFIGNFISILSLKNIPITVLSVGYLSSENKRLLPKGCLTFSFHTYIKDNTLNNVFSYKEAPIHNMYSIDKNGYSGWADISVNFENYRRDIEKITPDHASDIINRQYDFFLETKLSKYKQKDEVVKLPNKYVFFPLQVRNDSVAQLENIDTLDVLEEAIKIAEEKKVYLVVKRHPLCISEVTKNAISRMESKYKYFLTTDGNIHDIIKNAHSILACNSGVSIEALIANKPVYCFGTSEWYEATNKIEKLEDVKNAFYDNPKKMNDFQKKIVAYLLSTYWVRYDDYIALNNRIDDCIKSYNSVYGTDLEDSSIVEELTKKIINIENSKSSAERELFEIRRDYKRLKKQNKYNFVYFLKNSFYRFLKK